MHGVSIIGVGVGVFSNSLFTTIKWLPGFDFIISSPLVFSAYTDI